MLSRWQPTICSPRDKVSTGKHGRANKRPPRKLVLSTFGFLANNIFVLLGFLVLCNLYIPVVESGQVSPSSVTGLGKPISSTTGKDGGSGRGAVTDDAELPSHRHQHSYHRHHRHTTSGKPQSASSSTTSASYGYLHDYYQEPFYEPRYYDRPSREFSARSTSYPTMAVAASSPQVGFTDTEYGGLAAASGHGGGHGGHGHNEGYGHGHHTTYYKTVKTVDQSSLGLLGLLGLLSLLSNVLLLLTTTARSSTMMMGAAGMGAATGRRKRDTMMLLNIKDEDYQIRDHRSVVERLSRLILPSLNIVGHAKDGRIPLNCTYQEVCKTNRALVQVFGIDEGKPVASVLSTAIVKLLTNDSGKPSHNHGFHNGTKIFTSIRKHLTEAGLAGRNGDDCAIIYPTCSALNDTSDEFTSNGIKKGGNPLPLLVSPDHALKIILGDRASL